MLEALELIQNDDVRFERFDTCGSENCAKAADELRSLSIVTVGDGAVLARKDGTELVESRPQRRLSLRAELGIAQVEITCESFPQAAVDCIVVVVPRVRCKAIAVRPSA